MCGRFECKTKIDDLEKIFRKHIGKLHIDYDIDELLKEENIAPTNRVRVIVMEDGKFKVKVMKWAIRTKVFDPSKKGKPDIEPFIEKDIFNSRIETVKKSPQRKSLIINNRCLFPMTAFYEWIPKAGKKEPQRIYLEEDKLFFAGGIYKPSDLKKETGASILTCNPNRFMKPMHNRMPVLFTPKNAVEFLTTPKEAVFDLCEPLDDKIQMDLEKAKI